MSSSSPEAGPSNHRHRRRNDLSPSASRSPLPTSTSTLPTRTFSAEMSQPRKKPRMTLEEMFVKPDVKEKIRQGQTLRDLQSQVDDDRHRIAHLKVSDLEANMQRLDDVFQEIRDTETGLHDARVFASQLEVAHAWAKNQHQNINSFDTDEFLLKVKGLLGDGIPAEISDEEDELDGDDDLDDGDPGMERRRRRGGRGRHGEMGDWAKIGWMAAKMYRRVQGMEFMYGPLTLEHKKRTQTQRQKRAQIAPETRPLEITREMEKNVDHTPNYVRTVHKVLAKADPTSSGLNFFRFALNPKSFGQSVENIFFISFLIHEGRAGIEVRPEGEIIIRYREPPDGEAGEHVSKNQGVMEFDEETWELAIQTFGITESMIPHREPINQGVPAANSWY